MGLSIKTTINDEDARSIENHLDKVLAIMNTAGNLNLEPTKVVNVKEKIETQPRLYSLKKKKFKNNELQKPSVNEEKAILGGLLDNYDKSVNIHTGFDHTYN